MATTIILFITEQLVKDTSLIDENVDVQLIRNTIREAQELHIHEILGTGLYDELVSQISAGTTTALNITLLDSYVRNALLYWTLYEGVDTFVYKFRNKGIMKMNSEEAQAISLEEVKRLMDSFRNKAEFYSQRVTNYLLQNETSYPLYTNPGNGIDTVYPRRNNYSTGWYLGNTKKDSDWNPYENISDCE